jgi:hypothetical protein
MSRIDPIWLPMTVLGLFAFLGAFLTQTLRKFPLEQKEIHLDEGISDEASVKEPLLKKKKN